MRYSVNWSRFVLRYALVLMCISLLLFVVAWFFHYSLRSSAATLVPIMLVAMLEGAEYARAEGAMPKGGWAWRQSILFALVGCGVTMAFAAFFMVAFPGGMGLFLTPKGFASLSAITVLMIVAILLGTRLFFWLGARSELKNQRRE